MFKQYRSKQYKAGLKAVLLFAVLTLLICGIWTPAKAAGPAGAAAPAVSGDGVHYTGGLPSDPANAHKLSVPGAGLPLSASVDLSSQIPPIGNQGIQSSCVAWASSYYYRSWSEKQEDSSRNLNDTANQFSPSFVYNQINGGVDNGSSFDDAFNLMQDKGDISIKEMPYNAADFTTQPTAAQLNAAEQYSISGDWGYFWLRQGGKPYSPPNDLSGIKAWLASGKMLTMLMPLYQDFPDYYGNPVSTYYDYNGAAGYVGYHGVAIVGYNDNINPSGSDADHKGGFLMANSWGAGWNGNGYVYLSYDFVKRYVAEAWGMDDQTAVSTWYLAEGSTAWGFECHVTIENPNNNSVTCDVTYMTSNGAVAGPVVNMPAKSQATINPADTLGSKDFSTRVECEEGDPIAVDRTMLWDQAGSTWPEAHCSIGVTAPDTTWYLAEGSSAWGFECWLLIQNPQNQTANCQVTYMIEGEGPKTVQKTVPARSRETFNIANDIGAKDASIKVQSNVPVIPERAMYRNSRREGHDSIGTTQPTTTYYLAEGATGYDSSFVTFVLIQNPNDTANDVTVTYMTAGGPAPQPTFQMPANSRKTIRVNDVLPTNTDFSTAVTGTQPLIAERAMYWFGNPYSGEVCHDSIGMSAPHVKFYLPAGGTTNDWETWTLVQNPNDSNVTVEISYLMPDGKNNVVFQETIPARSRKSFSMVAEIPNDSAAVMVRSLDSTKMIMVERAMYWHGRNAGTSTIGGYSDSPW